MSETREALAPCPFCGGHRTEPRCDGDRAWIECSACLTQGPAVTYEDLHLPLLDAAEAAWNRRALSARDERAEERERCAKIADAEAAKYAEELADMKKRGIGPQIMFLASQLERQSSDIAAAIRAGGTDGH